MFNSGDTGAVDADAKQRSLYFMLIAADVLVWATASAMLASYGL
jgi:hypothetical protein